MVGSIQCNGRIQPGLQRSVEGGCDGEAEIGWGWWSGDASSRSSAGGSQGAPAAVLGDDCSWCLERECGAWRWVSVPVGVGWFSDGGGMSSITQAPQRTSRPSRPPSTADHARHSDGEHHQQRHSTSIYDPFNNTALRAPLKSAMYIRSSASRMPSASRKSTAPAIGCSSHTTLRCAPSVSLTSAKRPRSGDASQGAHREAGNRERPRSAEDRL